MFNLPKLIILALGALAVWYGYRAIKGEIGRVRSKLRKADEEKNKTVNEVQPLEKDKDGVYRIKDD